MTAQDRGTHAAESPAPQPPLAEPEAGTVSDPNPQGVAPVLAETSDVDYTVPAVIPDDDALSRLDWHLKMARKYTAELAEFGAPFVAEINRLNAEITRLEEVLEHRARVINNKIDWHLAPVESYHRAHPDKRTLELPNGTSKLTVPIKPEVYPFGDLGDKLADWARTTHPEIMKPPSITDIRRVVTIKKRDDGSMIVVDKNGEIVPGVVAQVPRTTCKVDVAGGGPF